MVFVGPVTFLAVPCVQLVFTLPCRQDPRGDGPQDTPAIAIVVKVALRIGS